MITIEGGMSDDTKAASDEIQRLVDEVQEEIKGQSGGKQFSQLKAISYKSQLVAGTNYFVKVLTILIIYFKFIAYCREIILLFFVIVGSNGRRWPHSCQNIQTTSGLWRQIKTNSHSTRQESLRFDYIFLRLD